MVRPGGRRLAGATRSERDTGGGSYGSDNGGSAAPTGLMLKERRTVATQKVSYYRAGSAGSRLSSVDLDPLLIAGASVLHVSGITPALSGSAASAVRQAMEMARWNRA